MRLRDNYIVHEAVLKIKAKEFDDVRLGSTGAG